MLLSQIIPVVTLFFPSNFVNCDPLFPPERTTSKAQSRIQARNTKARDLNNQKSSTNNFLWLPPQGPHQTIGDYLDKIDDNDSNSKNKLNNKKLTSRNLLRGSDTLKYIWHNSAQHYNITISKCIQFSQTIGQWTSQDGTTNPNATMNDLNADFQTKSKTNNPPSRIPQKPHIQSRLLANAELALQEASQFLNTTICASSTSNQPPQKEQILHPELRKLQAHTPAQTGLELNTPFLALDGYWTAILLSMGAGAAVGGSLYKGFYNHNATVENTAVVCFTAAGLIFTRGVIERLYMTGALQYTEASIVAAFVAWFRGVVRFLGGEFLGRVGADDVAAVAGLEGGNLKAPVGCLDIGIVEEGVDGLRRFEQVAAGVLEVVGVEGC